MRYLILSILFFNCGTQTRFNEDRQVERKVELGNILIVMDDRLQPYVDQFKKDYKRLVGKDFSLSRRIIVTVEDSKENFAGACYYNYPRYRKIIIDEDTYKKYAIYGDNRQPRMSRTLYITFLHEIGHCAYDLGHTVEGEKPRLMGGRISPRTTGRGVIKEYFNFLKSEVGV